MPNRRRDDDDAQVTADLGTKSSIPHRSLGRALRTMREEAGLSISLAARAIERGAGTLHRLETGAPHVRVRDEDLVNLCKLYQQTDMLPILRSLAEHGRTPSWLDEFPDQVNPTFNAYLHMEAAAANLAVYRPDLVAGLFQTPDYARALDRLYFPGDSPDDLERRVRVRQLRHNLVTRDLAPLSVDLILDEGVTRKIVGSRSVMSAQLRHLSDLPPTVRVHVLPDRVGVPLGTSTGPFVVLDFYQGNQGATEPPVVYIESYTGNLYLEKPDTVRRYRAAFETIKRVALDVPDSKRLLRQRAREYSR